MMTSLSPRLPWIQRNEIDTASIRGFLGRLTNTIGIAAAFLISVSLASAMTLADEPDQADVEPAKTAANQPEIDGRKTTEEVTAPSSPPGEDPVTENDSISDRASATMGSPEAQLPPILPDRRRLEAYGIFASQLVEVVPDSYWPIEWTKLQKAIQQWSLQSDSLTSSYLRSAEYWIDIDAEKMSSNRSYIEIESLRPGVTRRSLGRTNLLIELSEARRGADEGSLPRLMTDPAGGLVAELDGTSPKRSRLEFKWQRFGKPSGTGYDFSIQIPRTAQTRMVVSADPDVRLTSPDAVVRQLPQPPSDAIQQEPATLRSWHEIEAGGASNIRLKTSKADTIADHETMIVRRASVDYDIQPSVVSWVYRIEATLPSDLEIAPFRLANSHVTSVTVNSSEATFTAETTGRLITQQGAVAVDEVAIETPLGVVSSDRPVASIAITGQTSWDVVCDLPTLVWNHQQVVSASVVDTANLTIAAPLTLAQWQLPVGWNDSVQTINERYEIHRASGANLLWSESAETSESSFFWSRLWLAVEPARKTVAVQSKFSLDEALIDGTVRFEFLVDASRLEPITFEIQPDWNVQRLVLPVSGREIETNSSSPGRQQITIWPEGNDLLSQEEIDGAADGVSSSTVNTDQSNDVDAEPSASPTDQQRSSRLAVEISGTREVQQRRKAMDLPVLWLARVQGEIHDVLAAIEPPLDMNWRGETSFDGAAVTEDELAPEEQNFFGVMNRKTLYFRLPQGKTPELTLSTPSVDYEAQTMLRIERVDDEWHEELTIKLSTRGRRLDQLIVRTGNAQGRPEYSWSIRGNSQTPSRNISPSNVQLSDPQDEGRYVLNLSAVDLENRWIVASRRFSANELSLELPGIPQATANQSEVVLGRGVELAARGRSVQLVPAPDRTHASTQQQQTRLRYEASFRPTINIYQSDDDHDINFVSRLVVTTVASSRGNDRVIVNLQASLSKPLVIDNDEHLRLHSVTRNGLPVDVSGFSSSKVVLTPDPDQLGSGSVSIRIQWNRSQINTGWYRRMRIPKLEFDAAVLQEEYRLIASQDTFAPIALIQNQQASNQGTIDQALAVAAGQSTILIRRNTALAFGWLAAMMVFVMGWLLMKRSAITVLVLLVIFTTCLCLFWPWRSILVGWMLVPLASSALLVAAQAWTSAGSQLQSVSDANESEPAHRRSESNVDDSADFSWASIFRTILIACVLGCHAWMPGHQVIAQDDRPTPVSNPSGQISASEPVRVLVPLDEKGNVTGDTVYIPRSFQDFLESSKTDPEVAEPHFESATYRLRISNDAFADENGFFEVDYVIHLFTRSTGPHRVMLPVRAASVRRIESVAETNRIIRFEADPDGKTIASLPTGRSHRIRLLIRPTIEQQDDWTRLRLKVPAIDQSVVEVDADFDLEAMRIGGDQGRLMVESDLRRWSAPIGSLEELVLDYRVAQDDEKQEPQRLQRHYWISANEKQVSIDCQITPPASVAAGETFRFVVLDSEMPSLASVNWQIIQSDLYTPSRRLVIVKSNRNNPGPVHLLWKQDIRQRTTTSEADGAAGAIDDRWQHKVRIPEVIAAALGDNAPAWLAFHCSPSLQWVPPANNTTEPIAVDQFLEKWDGYRGRVERAIVALAEIPQPVLVAVPTPQTKVDQRHRVHLTVDEVVVNYEATIVPGHPSARRYVLHVPRSLNVFEVRVDGQKISGAMILDRDRWIVPLGDFSAAKRHRVEAKTVDLIGSATRWQPVQIEIGFAGDHWGSPQEATAAARVGAGEPKDSPDDSPRERLPIRSSAIESIDTTSLYQVTRDDTCEVLLIGDPFTGADRLETGIRADLAGRTIPVGAWRLDRRANDSIDRLATGLTNRWQPGWFKLRRRSTRFDCDQVVTLSRDDGPWQMSVHVLLSPARVPDFVDIEVPKRWCESLAITPNSTWSQQPLADPESKLVRIRCDQGFDANQPIVLTGQLEQSDDNPITVPKVTVLGRGVRNVYVRVPKRLVSKTVQWRQSSVEPAKFSPRLISALQSNVEPTTDGWLELVAANSNWSVGLAPLPEVKLESIALGQDDHLFLNKRDVYVLSRWNLLPGNNNSVEISLPDGAECLGAWSADVAVPLERLALSTVRVPLKLSRLPQGLRVLIKRPFDSPVATDYLPRLAGVATKSHWMTVYTDEASANQTESPAMAQKEQERDLQLASTIVESVEDAADLLAERPNDEVASWLDGWLQRYTALASASDHSVDFGNHQPVPPGVFEPVGLTRETAGIDVRFVGLSGQRAWQSLDRRMGVLVNQYLPEFEAGNRRSLPHDPFTGLRVAGVSRVSFSNQPLSIHGDRVGNSNSAALLSKLLILVLVIGIVVCLRPIRHHVRGAAVHPAFWLVVLGAACFAVAPPYIAAGLVLVGISTPVFPKSRWARSWWARTA